MRYVFNHNGAIYSAIMVFIAGALLFSNAVYADKDKTCMLEGIWDVQDFYVDSKNEKDPIKKGDKLFIAGDDSDDWSIILAHYSAGGDMVPLCDSVQSSANNNSVVCEYDDKSQEKHFSAALIKSRDVGKGECKERAPDGLSEPCGDHQCVMKWSNRTQSELKVFNPPGDGGGTGGNDGQ